MDDEERMDLALNSNFDSELFDWDEDEAELVGDDEEDNDNEDNDEIDLPNESNGALSSERKQSLRKHHHHHHHQHHPSDKWEMSETFEQFSRLPSFNMDYDSSVRRSSRDELLLTASELEDVVLAASSQTQLLQQQQQQNSVDGTRTMPSPVSGASAGKAALVSAYASLASSRSRSEQGTSTEQPYGKSSSVTADSASSITSSSQNSTIPTNSGGKISPHEASSTQLHPMAIQSSANCPPHLEASSSSSCSNGLLQGVIPPTAQNIDHTIPNNLLPLAMNALAAGASLHHNPFLLHAVQHHHPSATAEAAAATVGDNLSLMHPLSQQQPMFTTTMNSGSLGSSLLLQQNQQEQLPQALQQVSSGNVPPFLLFDAPVELRTNFQNSLRAQGLPVTLDNNSYHFGVSVNGFHPQAATSSSGTTFGNHQHHIHRQGAASAAGGTIPTMNAPGVVKLVDARHGPLGGGGKRIKNAKEQRRAQKIAELIDELRAKMQSSGWSVGVSKSKYNTLSSCAEYVKHLVKATKEKEEAVRQARNDLDTKRQKMEEEKSQQDPSDPESTTSTLTASSSSAAAAAAAATTTTTGAVKIPATSSTTAAKGDRKRELSKDTSTDESQQAKKPKLCSHESSVSSFGGDDNPSDSNAVMLDAATSSVSDLTDSNQGPMTRTRSRLSANVDGPDAKNKEQVHKDIVVHKRKSAKSESSHSLAADFQLDYREVFVKSNVPQLIATTAGRIIAYNEFFLAITGLSVKSVERATIFNLVQSSKLSSLFEIVAKSLRAADPKTGEPTSTNETEQENQSSRSSQKTWDYEAMTLPCIRFPSERPTQLYITVTLMDDVNPRKRCFHCVLTDSPCTNGDIGHITPDLLETMFSSSKQQLHRRGKKKTK